MVFCFPGSKIEFQKNRVRIDSWFLKLGDDIRTMCIIS